MCAWIRYFFQVDPYELDTDELVRLWREAEYLLMMTKPISHAKGI